MTEVIFELRISVTMIEGVKGSGTSITRPMKQLKVFLKGTPRIPLHREAEFVFNAVTSDGVTQHRFLCEGVTEEVFQFGHVRALLLHQPEFGSPITLTRGEEILRGIVASASHAGFREVNEHGNPCK